MMGVAVPGFAMGRKQEREHQQQQTGVPGEGQVRIETSIGAGRKESKREKKRIDELYGDGQSNRSNWMVSEGSRGNRGACCFTRVRMVEVSQPAPS